MSRSLPSLGGAVGGAVVAVLLLGGCGLVGGSAGTSGTTSAGGEAQAAEAAEGAEEPAADRDPAQVVSDAAGTTLALTRLTLESRADLDVGDTTYSTVTEGSVDHEAGLFDLDRDVDGTTEIGVVADGSRAWIKNEGPDGSPFEDGATWLQGDVDDLAASGMFGTVPLLGSMLPLRAADDDPAAVVEGEPTTYDGVECRVFTLTVPYAAAVDAAGEDADAFTEALSLTGPARRADLALEVAVGPDDVVRSYRLEVVSAPGVSGGYDVTLTDIGEPVATPLAPDPTDTLSGPEATEQFKELVS
ncbi:hypothetical protein [Nocardioides sp. CFH 31398]|uniref:hypothetical protein n=1 Tax=Nocardioides sp. CFH 31398 TaxID=2919579 RepID=UPI001F06D30A|nr:hypothetical protein [Nocardioides sp. CFH 31398]MCH1866100.1 hypothetical protein [Nocardioides sp. CFH 31398]